MAHRGLRPRQRTVEESRSEPPLASVDDVGSDRLVIYPATHGLRPLRATMWHAVLDCSTDFDRGSEGGQEVDARSTGYLPGDRFAEVAGVAGPDVPKPRREAGLLNRPAPRRG